MTSLLTWQHHNQHHNRHHDRHHNRHHDRHHNRHYYSLHDWYHNWHHVTIDKMTLQPTAGLTSQPTSSEMTSWTTSQPTSRLNPRHHNQQGDITTDMTQGRSGRYNQYSHGRTGFWKTTILFWAWFLESHSFVAITVSSCEVPLPEIGESPNQPGDFRFPS